MRIYKQFVGVLMKNFRKEKRLLVAYSVRLGNAGGITRDISPSGMYIEADLADASYAPGSRINSTIRLNDSRGKLMLMCDGEIVRIESRDGEVGVTVKIIRTVMAPWCASGISVARCSSARRH